MYGIVNSATGNRVCVDGFDATHGTNGARWATYSEAKRAAIYFAVAYCGHYRIIDGI